VLLLLDSPLLSAVLMLGQELVEVLFLLLELEAVLFAVVALVAAILQREQEASAGLLETRALVLGQAPVAFAVTAVAVARGYYLLRHWIHNRRKSIFPVLLRGLARAEERQPRLYPPRNYLFFSLRVPRWRRSSRNAFELLPRSRFAFVLVFLGSLLLVMLALESLRGPVDFGL